MQNKVSAPLQSGFGSHVLKHLIHISISFKISMSKYSQTHCGHIGAIVCATQRCYAPPLAWDIVFLEKLL